MERKDIVLTNLTKLLKDEKILSGLKEVGDLSEGYRVLKNQIGDITEIEYKEAIETIKQKNEKVTINLETQLSDDELDAVSGGMCTLSHEVKL